MDFKSAELALTGLKALGTAPENLLSNRIYGFELAGFEKLFANSIAFHAKGLKFY